MDLIAFCARRGPVSPEKFFGSADSRISASWITARGWSQADLTEFTIVSSSGQMKPAKHRIKVGMTFDSKGYASNVTCGTDQILWSTTVLRSSREAP